MNALSRRSLLGAALALAAALPLAAQAQSSERDRADIARIEKYMNSITTLRAKFVQTEEDGRQPGPGQLQDQL